jgi:hypothetical protein
VSGDPLLHLEGDIHERFEVIETESGAVATGDLAGWLSVEACGSRRKAWHGEMMVLISATLIE